ncbi:MarR family winged helix-turn-helix transcriptional regulator [Bradyrhizobium sp. 2TAF24]|uniref:MarR family winged helix-turn-helix transcriptional regulator n=1 Tax=Bradyrhizobium sp. 2TAF24 TaxID=3233011 RepID=UPI003F912974
MSAKKSRSSTPRSEAEQSPLKQKALPLPAPAGRPRTVPLTVSRPELLVQGSDRAFRSLVHGLFGFFARHEAVRAGHGARIGLVGIEYTVLISIGHLSAEEGQVSVNRLAEHLYLSGAFVTTLTNQLLKRGLIHKTPDPSDRRRVLLEISQEGWARLAELAPVQRKVNDVQFDCLSAAEFQQLLSMVNRLIESSNRALSLQAYYAGGGEGAMPTDERPMKRGSKQSRRLSAQ